MEPAAGRLLVASHTLLEPQFFQSVIFLMEHDHNGSMGFIVNRPLPMTLGELWLDCPDEIAHLRIAADGGPVDKGRGFFLHRHPSLAGAQAIHQDIAVGGAGDDLVHHFAAGPSASGPRLFLGHSGWAPGQLAAEIDQGSWSVHAGSPEMLLLPPEDCWQHLIEGRTRRPRPGPSLN